ncbi:AAA family ATPase [Thermodesulfobacteriota bacterium]
MRLSSFHIDGFGIFHDESLDGLVPGLVLFQGNNEAGKSTLLGFMRAVLFGFPRANSTDPNFPPLVGGTHGGSIGLITTDGKEFIVERKPGKKGGRITITGAGGIQGGPELLQTLMVGLTYEVFKNIYAFSLAELQTIETLKAESVKGVIYGATAGLAMQSLPKAYKKIKTRIDELFKPGGSKPAINRKISELEHIRSELRKASKGISAYDQMCLDLMQAEDKIKTLQNKLARIGADKNRYDAYTRLWPEWIDLQENEAALQEMVEIVEKFPENGLARLEKEMGDRENQQNQLAELDSQHRQLGAELQALTVNSPLLDQSETVVFLLEKKSEFVEKRNALPLKRQQKKTLQIEIRNLLDSLGQDWSEENLLAVDRSLFTRESVHQWEEKFNKLERDFRTAEEILADKKNQFDHAGGEERQAMKTLEQTGNLESEPDPQIVVKLQHGRDEFAGALRDIPKREAELLAAESQLRHLSQEIDPNWTGEELLHFDKSITARKKVENHAQRFKQSDWDIHEAETLQQSIEDGLKKAGARHQAVLSKLQNAPEPAIDSMEKLQAFKALVHDLERDVLHRDTIAREIKHQEERVSDKQEELKRLGQLPRTMHLNILIRLTGIFEICGLAALTAFVFFDRPPTAGITGGILFALALTSLVLYNLFERNNRDRQKAYESLANPILGQIEMIESELGARRKEAANLNDNIRRRAKDLSLPGSFAAEDLNRLNRQIENDDRMIEERIRLEAEVQNVEADLIQLDDDLSGVRAKMDEYRNVFHTTEQGWKDYLRENKLDVGLSPETVGIIFGKIETGLELLNRVRTLRERIQDMENARDSYLEFTSSIPSLAAASHDSGADILSEVDKFFLRFEQQQKQREAHQYALKTLSEKRRAKENTQRALLTSQDIRDNIVLSKSDASEHWKSWLIERGLPEHLSPKTALEALDKMTNWIGDEGFLQRLNAKIVRHNPEGDFLIIRGQVSKKYQQGDKHCVDCELIATQQDDEKSCLATATAVLPSRE